MPPCTSRPAFLRCHPAFLLCHPAFLRCHPAFLRCHPARLALHRHKPKAARLVPPSAKPTKTCAETCVVRSHHEQSSAALLRRAGARARALLHARRGFDIRSWGTRIGVSIVIAIINVALKLIVQFLGRYEMHSTQSDKVGGTRWGAWAALPTHLRMRTSCPGGCA